DGWTPFFLPHWHDIGNRLPIQPGKYRGEQFLDIRPGDVVDVVASRNGVEEFEEQRSTTECPRVVPELLLRYPAADATIRFHRRVQPKHQLFGEGLLGLWDVTEQFLQVMVLLIIVVSLGRYGQRILGRLLRMADFLPRSFPHGAKH